MRHAYRTSPARPRPATERGRQPVVRHGNVGPVAPSTDSPVTVRPAGVLPWVALGVVYVLWGSTYLANRLIIADGAAAAARRGAVPGRRGAARPGRAGGRRTAGVPDDPGAVRHDGAVRAAAAGLGQRAGRARPAAGGVRAGRAADRLGAAATSCCCGRSPGTGRGWPRCSASGSASAGSPCCCSPARPAVRWRVRQRMVGPVAGAARRAWAGRPARSAPPGCPVPPNPFALAAVQMLVGGAVLLSISLGIGDRLDVAAVTPVAWWAWAYMAVVVAAGGVQRLRLRAGPPAGVHGGHLRLRQPGDRRAARRAGGGGAVLRRCSCSAGPSCWSRCCW